MTFAENLNRICKERGTSITASLRELGLSTSKTTAWNNGSLPKEETMITLAKHLNCSVMDFFADDVDTQTPHLDEDEKEIITAFRSFDRKHKHEFMAMLYEFDKAVQLGDNASTNCRNA